MTVFGLYELLERLFLRHASAELLHHIHLVRGMGSAVLLATWAFLRIRRERTQAERIVAQTLARLEDRVTQRTRELEEARAFTELLFDSLREQIVVRGVDGSLLKANRAALTALDETRGAERARGVRDNARSRHSPVHEPRELIVTTREASDARGVLWEIETIPVCSVDGVLPDMILEVRRDVTARRSLEAQVRHQEKMASLGLLAAGFAHDLGNPLASLSSELELLEDERDVDRMRASLSVLRQHVQRMSRTLREMVDFARRRRDQCADVSVAAVVRDAVRLLQYDPRWKRVSLEMAVPEGLGPVRMVEDHLLLVLLNLFVNAADAMPDGGTLCVSATTNGPSIDLRVCDSGCGMSPEVLAQATRPMYTTKPPGRGTGLGLSVSVDIVRAIGGRLTIHSELGRGTEVRLELPCRGTPRAAGIVHG